MVDDSTPSLAVRAGDLRDVAMILYGDPDKTEAARFRIRRAGIKPCESKVRNNRAVNLYDLDLVVEKCGTPRKPGLAGVEPKRRREISALGLAERRRRKEQRSEPDAG